MTNQVWSFRVVNGVAVDAENRTSQLIGVGGSVGSIALFRAIADSPLITTRDIIADFTQGNDRIGLNQIDARPGIGGDQAFAYIGTAAFTGEGQIRAKQVGDHVVLDINVGGSFAVDMQLTIRDTLVSQLDAADLIL